MKNPLVFIIILNWNGYKDTIQCINSLKKLTYKNYQILIVDNASSNASVKELKNKFPEITLIENRENYGFSGGCNVGIKYALKNNADYVLLLNNDTFVDMSFLSKLIAVSENDKKIGIVSPFIYYADKPTTIWSSGLNFNVRCAWPFADDTQNKKDTGQFKELRYTNFLTGCSMLIKKEVFKKIGLLKEEYFLYIEDMDFSVRTTKAGFKMCSVPSAKIWHKIGQSSKSEGDMKIRYYFIRNLILYFKYNYGIKDAYTFYYYFIKEYLYLMVIAIFNKDFNKVRLILFGLYHGFIGRTGHSSL